MMASKTNPSTYSEETIVSLAILALFLYAAYSKTILLQHNYDLHGWSTGDWLINYSTGFHRRGLIGELVFDLHRWLNINPVSIVLRLRTFIYQIIFISFFLIAVKKRLGFVELVLAAAPWGFMFVISDELAIARKEIILIACLSVFVLLNFLKRDDDQINNKYNFISVNSFYLLICLPALVLIHEGLFFYLQFFFLTVLLFEGFNRKALFTFLVPYFASIVALIACYVYRGDQHTADALCTSITSLGLDRSLCDGAIANLGESGKDFSPHWHTTSRLLPALISVCLLTFLPLFGYAFLAFKQQNRKKVLLLSLLALIPSLPLYFLAADWGRWIHISASCLFIILLSTKEINKIDFIGHPVYLGLVLLAFYIYIFEWKLSHYSGRYDELKWFTNDFHLWVRSFNLW